MREPDLFAGRAPAKVNLVLEVTGRRSDGYHEVDTILQTLELADRVVISSGGQRGVEVGGPFADGTPADETNLAWRAAVALGRRCGHSVETLRISLEKHIPPAGGLGGGASDAATTLRLLQRLWPEATDAMVYDAAVEVGSDEAFFLVGGTARARGRGERVEALQPPGRHGVVLFIPSQTLERKTARMFAVLDSRPFDRGQVAERFAASPLAMIGAVHVYNVFEQVAFEEFPGLGDLRSALGTRIGAPVRLAGAGPTLFWIGPEEDAAGVAGKAVGLDCTVIVTATVGQL
ncbi:MAG TPA: 4-(cytidine 5'-diphospho)-2-C-methyl-D-erythritol kinase [Tepidiformaceae bacterium]